MQVLNARQRRVMLAQQARHERIVRQYLEGDKLVELARRMHCSKQRVHQLLTVGLERAGCSSAKRGEAHRIPEAIATMRAYYSRMTL